MKIHQLIAIADSRKKRATEALTQFYHEFQKDASRYSGIQRTYRPAQEGGEVFPAEEKGVQQSVVAGLQGVTGLLAEAIDTTYAIDVANSTAKADVVFDGQTVVKDVPVITLIYLEKRFTDIRTAISKLPTLDPVETWNYDENAGAYKSKPMETAKTKKVLRNHVKAEATDKHPAQVETYSEDVTVGWWTTTKLSGAIHARDKATYLDRVTRLIEAVKIAREAANQASVEANKQLGKSLLDLVFKT